MKKNISLILILLLLLSNHTSINASVNCKYIESNEYDSVSSLKYSPDSKSFAFIALKNWKLVLVKDWVEINKYDNIRYGVQYSQDWKSFAFEATKNWKHIIVKDGIETNEYDNIWVPIYSPDWKSFAFEVTKNWKHIIVKDWIETNE